MLQYTLYRVSVPAVCFSTGHTVSCFSTGCTVFQYRLRISVTALDVLAPLLYMSVMPYLLGLSVLVLEKDSITQWAVRRVRELDLRLVAWTANHPAEKTFLAEYLHVPYLTDRLSDDPHLKAQ